MNLIMGLLGSLFRFVNRWVPWHRLPFFLALPNLAALRHDLRQRNLYGTQRSPGPAPQPGVQDQVNNRAADGSYNDLTHPKMGAAGTRFGRNVPLDQTFAEQDDQLLDPNPRLISKELLTRKTFKPVPHLSVNAAGWLQFMVHDWFSHGGNALPTDEAIPPLLREPIRVPIPAGDEWHEDPMIVYRTRPLVEDRVPEDEGKPAAYRNVSTQWWDASQLYGSSLARQIWLRTQAPMIDSAEAAAEQGEMLANGKLHLLPNGHLPRFTKHRSDGSPEILELNGEPGNAWLGLSVFHTLFAREHNHVCDQLAREYPQRAEDGEWLFQKARLIVAALLAKIHTVEWTPAILNTPELRFAMRANWWGLQGQRLVEGFGRFSDSELFSGIIGSETDHHAADYSITEEFNAVYRMHSLVPDRFSLRRYQDDAPIFDRDLSLQEIAGGRVPELYDQGVSLADAFYSLGTEHPGLLKLNNFPTVLQGLHKQAPSARVVDLGTIDILRDRERGVPRYCAFRRALRMTVPMSFEELCEHPEDAPRLREIYKDVEKVDLLVGCAAEKWPAGFGFSDTAFRIFILMASRRLKSDRFFTTHFTPEAYTTFGIRYVRDNSMTAVLLRHLPELAPRLDGVKNAFFPWKRGG